jgi:pimeloyl-ACP methyl ester carboxylesterase
MNPILLLHGAMGSASQLEPLKQKLELSGRKIYSMNFSGHSGEPFHEDFGIEAFADDVLLFLDRHQVPSVDIFGYSMGGYVALWMAYLFPHRIGKIITLGTKFDWSVESAEREVKKLNPEKIFEKVPAFARLLEHRHAPTDWKLLMQKTVDMMLDLGTKPMLTESVLNTISAPVEILLGDTDDMADKYFSERVSDWLPNGSFHLLENTPHPIEKVDLNKVTECILQP